MESEKVCLIVSLVQVLEPLKYYYVVESINKVKTNTLLNNKINTLLLCIIQY